MRCTLWQPSGSGCTSTDIELTDDVGRTFKEGTDYNVIPGEPDPYRGAYGKEEPGFARFSLDWLTGRGYRVLGGCSRFTNNARWWCDLLQRYHSTNAGAEGIVCTPWEGRENSFDEFAEYAWTHDKPNEFQLHEVQDGKPAW